MVTRFSFVGSGVSFQILEKKVVPFHEKISINLLKNAKFQKYENAGFYISPV